MATGKGTCPALAQVKLLHFLDTGEVRRSAWGRNVIQLSDLPPEHRTASADEEGDAISRFDRDLVAFERGRLVKALSESKGSISGAARLLGMSRNTVSQRMRKLGLRRQSFEY